MAHKTPPTAGDDTTSGDATGTTATAATAPRSNAFFTWMRELGIVREPGWIGGVSAGLATRLRIDVVIVRGLIVVLGLVGGPALLLYAAAWALLPDATGRIHLEELFRGVFDKAIAGIGAMLLLSFLPFAQGFGWWQSAVTGPGWYFGPSLGGIIWTIIVVGAIIWFVVWLANRSSAKVDGPAASASFTGTTGTAPAAAGVAGDTVNNPGPTAPPAPQAGAPDEAMASWREQQAAWKREHDAWRQQQAADLRAQHQLAAAEQRRINQAYATEQRRIAQEQDALTRPSSAFTLAAIGLALIAGAVTALWSVGFDWQVESKVVAAMSATLAVLALAIVVNGFRGRRSGGSSGLAVLIIIALVTTSFFGWVRGPIISNRTITWQPTLSQSETRAVISGDVELDLSDYFADDESGRGTVDLYVVSAMSM